MNTIVNTAFYGGLTAMKKFKKAVSEAFEIPLEAVGGSPLITLIGNEKIIIENTKGVARYENEKIRVNTSLGLAEIEGENICIKVLSDRCIIAEGKIDSVRFV